MKKRMVAAGSLVVVVLTLLAAMLWSPGRADALQQPTQQELSLITASPQEGFDLAVRLSRLGVTTTQPNREVLMELRADYANDAEDLIAVSQVVAIHFQTIAAANDYWR